MRCFILLVSVVVIVALSGTPFAFADDAKSTSIRLGMIAPLTGDYGAYGLHIKRGVEIALGELSKRGIPSVMYYEDACLPGRAVSAVSKLTAINKIDGLVGSYCVVGIIPSIPTLEKARVITFHSSVVPQELLDSGQYIFTTNARIGDEATKLAELAFTDLKARKASILYLTSQWGEEYQKYFAKRFSELGGAIVDNESAEIGENDFRAQLTRFKGHHPDVVFIVSVGVNLVNAFKQAHQLGLKAQLLTVNEAEEQEVLDAAKNFGEGIRFFAPEPMIETEAMKRFGEEFRQRFGREAHPLSRHAYDATILTATALAECRNDHECADKKLYAVKNYSGATGDFSIEEDGGTKREFVLKTIKEGHFVKVTQ